MDRIKRPFISLPYRKRRDVFIPWRWRILLDILIHGGRFTSQLRLVEQDEGSDWFDFLFVGSDGQTVWNAFIITARAAFLDVRATSRRFLELCDSKLALLGPQISSTMLTILPSSIRNDDAPEKASSCPAFHPFGRSIATTAGICDLN